MLLLVCNCTQYSNSNSSSHIPKHFLQHENLPIRIPSQLCNANSQNGCLVVMLADVNGNRKSLLCDFSKKQHSTFLTCANKMKNKMKEQIKGAFRPVSSGQRLSHSVKGGALCNRIWEREGKKEMAGGGNKREVE